VVNAGALLAELQALLGEGALLRDPAECLAYGYDNSRRQAQPLAVALPTERAQVQAIVRACRKYATPLTARGRGTNTTGASVPVAGGVVVSFERMNRLLEIRPGDRAAWSSPACSTGTCSARCWRTACLAARPDQRALLHHRRQPGLQRRRSARAEVRRQPRQRAVPAGGRRTRRVAALRRRHLEVLDGLRPVAAARGFGRHAGADRRGDAAAGAAGAGAASLRALYTDAGAAARAVARLMAQPVTPSMLEFMDADCVRLARELGGAQIPEAGALLMIEADGTPALLEDSLQALRAAAKGDGCLGIDSARDAAERNACGRRARRCRRPCAASPPARSTRTWWCRCRASPNWWPRSRRSPPPCAAHRVLRPRRQRQPAREPAVRSGRGRHRARTSAALDELFAATLALGGQLSGEHGIGLAKRDYMARALDPATLETMHAIKRVFDPDGILNPGKLLPPTGGK
jgi:D-lactate dehydrogenase